MSNLNAYTVFDIKANSFQRPFFALNDAVAVRSFGDAIAGRDSLLSAHPEDFILYCVGVFSEFSGELTTDKRRHVIDGVVCAPEADYKPELANSEDVANYRKAIAADRQRHVNGGKK